MTQIVVVDGGDRNRARLVERLSDTGQPCASVVGHTCDLTAVAIGEVDGGTRVIVAGGQDGTVRVWDLDIGAALPRFNVGSVVHSVGVAEITLPRHGKSNSASDAAFDEPGVGVCGGH